MLLWLANLGLAGGDGVVLATEVVQILVSSQRMSEILVLAEDSDDIVLYPERPDGIVVIKE